jgi:hypothetical protein
LKGAGKKDFFVNIKEEVEESDEQEKSQEKMFSQLKGVQDVKKKSMIQWMEMRIKEAEEKQFVIPRIGLRHHAVMNEGLQNKFRMFEEASCYADFLCAGCEEDEMYLETFVEFVTKVLQRHIGEAYGKTVIVRNSRRTIPDENKLRNKAINVIRLSNGKEIRTENITEINTNVIKAEMSAISIRAVIENYKMLYRSIFEVEFGFKYGHEKNPKPEIVWDDEKVIDRHRANWAENVCCNAIMIENYGIQDEIILKLKAAANDYISKNGYIKELSGEEEQHLEELAERTIEGPYKEWMMKEKTKIHYNFAEDAKRTWNRIKQICGQATKILPQKFKEHYEKNWSNAPEEIGIDDNSRFIIQRKLVLKDGDMQKYLLNKKMMVQAIARNGNLSAPGIGKVTFPY